jgi:hypothetical protein
MPALTGGIKTWHCNKISGGKRIPGGSLDGAVPSTKSKRKVAFGFVEAARF